MKRLFIAFKIPLDNNFIAACQSLQQSSTKLDKINWIQPENLHITLKFLGDTNDDLIPSIENNIEKLTSHITPFEITLNHIGAFGSRYHPRIIWIGSNDVIPEINVLHKSLEKSMSAFGFKPTFGNFVFHATLARIHKIDDKKYFWNEIEKKTSLFSFTFKVNELILFESILTRTFTPLYKKQKTFYLKSGK